MLKKIFGLLVIIIFFSSLFFGCNRHYIKHQEELDGISEKIDRDLSNLEQGIILDSQNFASMEHIELDNHELIKYYDRYKVNQYGMMFNKNSFHSTGLLTGYKEINFKLRKRLYQTEKLEMILIDRYNQSPIVDQCYYIEGNGLLRIYPSIRVEDNISPKVNFLSLKVFEPILDEIPEEIHWSNRPFLNPSGREWVISLFKPIVNEGDLIGILGYDIVVDNFRKRYLKKDMMLINYEGDIISMDPTLNELLNINSNDDNLYYEDFMKGKYRIRDYNLKHNKIKDVRKLYIDMQNGERRIDISLHNDEEYTVMVSEVETLGGYLLKFMLKN